MRLTAVLVCVLVGCSSSTKEATTTTVASTAPTTTAAPVSTSVPSDPCDLGPAYVPPTWPRSGAVRGVPIAEVGAAAEQFAKTELAVTDARALGGLEVDASACKVRMTITGLDGEVAFFRDGTGSYVASGLHAGPDLGGSLLVQGRHVEAHIATECTTCATWEMHIRYGEVTASVPPGPSSAMSVDLPSDPSVEGAYVFIERDATGVVVGASATAIRPGDFAAS
jgi:hypothetical protein